MKIKLLLLLLLGLSLPSHAQWTNSGATWSYGQQVSLTIPEGLAGTLNPKGALVIADPSGVYNISFVPVATEGDAAKTVAAMIGIAKSVITDAKLGEPKGGQLGAYSLQVVNGPGTIEKIPMDVTIGTLHNEARYLCFLGLMTQADMAKWDPLTKALMESVKFN